MVCASNPTWVGEDKKLQAALRAPRLVLVQCELVRLINLLDQPSDDGTGPGKFFTKPFLRQCLLAPPLPAKGAPAGGASRAEAYGNAAAMGVGGRASYYQAPDVNFRPSSGGGRVQTFYAPSPYTQAP
eukprot:tig00000093_g3650.t1